MWGGAQIGARCAAWLADPAAGGVRRTPTIRHYSDPSRLQVGQRIRRCASGSRVRTGVDTPRLRPGLPCSAPKAGTVIAADDRFQAAAGSEPGYGFGDLGAGELDGKVPAHRDCIRPIGLSTGLVPGGRQAQGRWWRQPSSTGGPRGTSTTAGSRWPASLAGDHIQLSPRAPAQQRAVATRRIRRPWRRSSR